MDERVALNFGDAPARYPVEGYAPLQAPPDEATVLTPAERGLRVFEALAAPPEFPRRLRVKEAQSDDRFSCDSRRRR